MTLIIVLVAGIILTVFGTCELITAWKTRRISKDILKQNEELWGRIKELK